MFNEREENGGSKVGHKKLQKNFLVEELPRFQKSSYVKSKSKTR